MYKPLIKDKSTAYLQVLPTLNPLDCFLAYLLRTSTQIKILDGCIIIHLTIAIDASLVPWIISVLRI